MIETVIIPGEPPCPRPWYKKINPLWWFGNDVTDDTNTFVYKYLRNFMQNFRWYVVGCVDRDHTVKGPAPAADCLWIDTDQARTGWKWAIVGGWRPFISYCKGKTATGEGFVFYLGWQPRGGLGARITWG